jgi:hypothetical protein
MPFGTSILGVILDRLKKTIKHKKIILKQDNQDFA